MCNYGQRAGIAQRLEHQPSKLRVASSNLVSRSISEFTSHSPPARLIDAHVAQSVEHFLGKEEVSGSSPDVGSIHLFNDL